MHTVVFFFLICNLETIYSQSTEDLSMTYNLPVTLVINYYKLGDLKQQKIILSQLWKFRVQNQDSTGLVPPWGLRARICSKAPSFC